MVEDTRVVLVRGTSAVTITESKLAPYAYLVAHSYARVKILQLWGQWNRDLGQKDLILILVQATAK